MSEKRYTPTPNPAYCAAYDEHSEECRNCNKKSVDITLATILQECAAFYDVFKGLEKRLEEILKLVEKNGSVTVQELTEHLQASESTIRRDLCLLDEEGRLNKVHGGATAINAYYASGKDVEVEYRKNLSREEKTAIAKSAAPLIKAGDLVYPDA